MPTLTDAITLLQPHRSTADQRAGCALLAEINTPEAIEWLLSTLGANDPHLFEAAVNGLLKTGTDHLSPALIEVLQKEDPWGLHHRIAAAALGQKGDASAIPVLLQLTTTHHWHRVRETAATALGRFNAPEATSALITLLSDSDYAVQCAAATSLGMIHANMAAHSRGNATRALCEAMQRRDPWGLLQNAAIKALENIKDPVATAPLVNLLKHSHHSLIVVDHILDALVAIKEGVVGPLLEVLPDVTTPIQTAIARVLFQLNETGLSAAFPGALYATRQKHLDHLLSLVKTGDVRFISTLVKRLKQLHAPASTTESLNKTHLQTLLKQIYALSSEMNLHLICWQDLTWFTLFTINKIPFYACRTCGETYHALQTHRVVALLDEHAPAATFSGDDTLYVNALSRTMMFDFDEVEIGDTDDEAVVRFCVLAGNDADPFRKKQTPYKIRKHNLLNQNTLRILEKTFGVADQLPKPVGF